MTSKLPLIHHIICEGVSEVAYLRQWNRILSEGGAPVSFHAIDAGGCRPALFQRAYREHRFNRRDKVSLLMDDDCYPPGGLGVLSNCRVFLNTQNFEDFLSLHLPFEQAAQWCNLCVARNHFQVPMRAAEYMQLFQQILPDYKKSCLPTHFLTPERLNNLQHNVESRKLHQKSTFAQFLIREMIPLLG